MYPINKTQYLEIINNPNQNIVVKSVKRGNSFIETAYTGIEIVAQRIITATGVKYFKA